MDYANRLEVTMEHQVRTQYAANYKAQAVSLAETFGATKSARKLWISLCHNASQLDSHIP